MSNDSTIEDIRERKRKEIERKATGEEPAPSGSPDEPIRVGSAAELASATDDYGVVLVDFYADWCGPCQMLEPVVESVAATTDAAVAKVDVDANQDLAAQYGVQGVPTMVLFADGQPVERMVGVQDENTLRNLVEQHA